MVDWRVGSDRGKSRNSLVSASLERGSEWILFLDDDHSFPPNLLDVLLSRNVPVVASLYLQRTDPFLPIAFIKKSEDGEYWPLDLLECPEHGLVTVHGAGTGGMLIKSEVFKEFPEPWFVHTTQQSEDLYFCDRLAEAGIQLYVDLDARLGHVAPVSVYPDWEDGWCAGLAMSPTMKVLLPINMPEEVQDPGMTSAPAQESSPVTVDLVADFLAGEFTGDAEKPKIPLAPSLATRVEMYPDDQGRWHARGVTEEGEILEQQLPTFDRDSAEDQARGRWPGLDIYEVADQNSSSVWSGVGPRLRY